MSKPIEMMMDGIVWTMVEPLTDEEITESEKSGIPYVTHVGKLNLMGNEMTCFQLSNGQRVFDAKSFERFFNTDGK